MAGTFPTYDGWISSIEKQGDKVLAYFLTSEYSQSVLYQGNIASLQYLVRRFGDDQVELQRQVQEVLQDLMERYFGSVDVGITVKADTNDESRLIIQFSCIIRDAVPEVSLGRRVEMIDGTLAKIVTINNG